MPERKRDRRGRVKVIPNGVKRRVTITLPQSDWECIDVFISTGSFTGMAEYFRKLHMIRFKQLSESRNTREIRA